jgi:hypothetical protein
VAQRAPRQPLDDAKGTRQQFPTLAIGVAIGIDLVAAGLLGVRLISGALALHLVSTGSLLLARGLRGSRRALLLAFSLTLPIVGGLAAAMVLVRKGSGDGGLAIDLEVGISDEDAPPSGPNVALIRTFADALPVADALLVAGTEDRRAMLWALGRRFDADAVTVLRWALTAASNELGLEAALALEDLAISFERQLQTHREALTAAPTHDQAMAAGHWIARGFEVGLIDVARVGAFAKEARGHFATARTLRPEAAAEITLAHARMELSILRPDKALDLLDAALAAEAGPLRGELRALREEAALCAHDLPWEGPSMLRTYRRRAPARGRKSRRGSGAIAASNELLRRGGTG